MTPYHLLLEQHIGDRQVSEIAREWHIPPYVLYDGLYENTRSPSARYLPAVAAGMGLSVDDLLRKLNPPAEEAAPRPAPVPARGRTA